MSLYLNYRVLYLLLGLLFTCQGLQSQEKLFQDILFYRLREQAVKSKYKKPVIIDNSFIQSYKGGLGLWQMIDSQNLLKRFIQKDRTNINQFNEINGISQDAHLYGWYFIPYSDQYLKKLKDRNILRNTLFVFEGEFIWPVIGSHITSRVGKRWGISHRGLDIATSLGSIVLAAQSGVVTKTGPMGGYGIMVSMEHEQGYATHYAHLSAALVKKGELVQKGQIIALSGNSGRSTGPHLHFELSCKKITLDPENFLPPFRDSMESSQLFQAQIFSREKIQN